jgi:predicted N-formylglutamate amidohydrolase
MAGPRASLRVVVSCEHGGNEIPEPYQGLFRGTRRLLDSHRGYDPGALPLARILSRRTRGPLHFSEVSRLLVELNRSPSHPRLFSEFTRPLPATVRERILERYYRPHRAALEKRIADYRAIGDDVLHVASHSFTPELLGTERTADVAWLYDPRHPGERALALLFRENLSLRRPDLRLRFNYPYRGASDGLTTYLRKRFGRGYLGIELEVNQRFYFGDGAEWNELCRSVADALARTLKERARARSGSRARR